MFVVFFFFFKQKTAYEMRISDWSSDVCSSDLGVTALWFSFRPLKHEVGLKMLGAVVVFGLSTIGFGLSTFVPLSFGCLVILGAANMFSVYIRQSLIQLHTPDEMRGRVRSEERRVGKEGVITCKSRWSPNH